MKKELWVSYLLAVLGFFGIGGVHRFYLGKPISGLLYLFTGGLFGIGTVVDLVRMPDLVATENLRLLAASADPALGLHGDAETSAKLAQLMGRQRPPALLPPSAAPATPPAEDLSVKAEHQILQLAKQRGGTVTIAMVALETGLPMAQAKTELERLTQSGFCRVDVAEDGAEVYLFPGLASTRPIMTS
ncbi:MAG: TM2 domain-containing protein [Deltaproteobacteria bacterium]|nr:TM2 domain-containing protein [Deltaproteobacteria bacterium]